MIRVEINVTRWGQCLRGCDWDPGKHYEHTFSTLLILSKFDRVN